MRKALDVEKWQPAQQQPLKQSYAKNKDLVLRKNSRKMRATTRKKP